MVVAVIEVDGVVFQAFEYTELVTHLVDHVLGRCVGHLHFERSDLIGQRRALAFQRVEDHRPPSWPDGNPPQQAHLDFETDDIDAAEARALAAGARKADVQPGPRYFRVVLDPAGHPFCLVRTLEQRREIAARGGETT